MEERHGLYLDWCEHCDEARVRVRRGVGTTFDALVRVYSDPTRAYSNLSLLESLFGRVHFLESKRARRVPLSVKFALWCHALEVRPLEHRGFASERNAKVARELLFGLFMEREDVLSGMSAIFSSQGHQGEEQVLFSDLLHSELAPECYGEFQEREKRREQEFELFCRAIGKPDLVTGWEVTRAFELRKLAQEEVLFRSPELRALEPIAREHLKRALAL